MYKKSTTGWLKHLDFLIIDIISLEIALFCSYFVRNGFPSIFTDVLYRNMAFVFLLLDVFVMFFGETFSGVLRRGYYQELVATVKHSVTVILLAVLYLFAFQRGNDYSRIIMFLTGGIYLVLSYITRRLWRLYLEKVKFKEKGKRSMVIIAARDNVDDVVYELVESNYERMDINGIVVVDVDMEGEKILGIPVVANKENAIEYICRQWVDEAFIHLSENMPDREELITSLIEMGITIHYSMIKLDAILTKKQYVEKMGPYMVLSVGGNMITMRQALMKRLMDIAGGIVGCIITGILFLFVAPVIYIKSPGPIFFKQTRIGKNGKKFKIYKFRSMYVDAEERKKELMEQNKVKDGMMFKMDYDPRIIGCEKGPGKGIGNFIRKTSIDEFPQFINVLKGDMSLVGTRPPTVDEWEKYQFHHRTRLTIKPGITGLWQVSGRSSITDFEEVVKLDTQYIADWNLGLDIKILFKTVRVVFKRDGAA
ncbi:sugar transferase [Frisingicoccus sp.]|uniref:sugar transferase n=1 Tax=Frisingicoccus sp. TaxID=1918627 RepID=UPI00386E91CB